MSFSTGSPPLPPSFFYSLEQYEPDLETILEEETQQEPESDDSLPIPTNWPNIPFGD